MIRCVAAIAILASVIIGCGGEAPSSRLIEGRDLYANSCSACHGSAGEGGTAPPLHDVRETFPSCDAHIEWVTLGSQIWKQVHGSTYGTNNSPITGVMPSHREQFTAEQIALVSAFERFQYGGMEEEEAFDDCGLNL